MVGRRRRWSAIVKRWEPFLAPCLAGRVELHATHYRGAHDEEGRGWITLDGEQIASFESIPFLRRVYGQLRGTDEGFQAASDEGLMHLWSFERAVSTYPDHTVEEALASREFIVRALAMVDRRLGKRRLAALDPGAEAHPIVRRLLEVRLLAEALPLQPRPHPGQG